MVTEDKILWLQLNSFLQGKMTHSALTERQKNQQGTSHEEKIRNLPSFDPLEVILTVEKRRKEPCDLRSCLSIKWRTEAENTWILLHN